MLYLIYLLIAAWCNSALAAPAASPLPLMGAGPGGVIVAGYQGPCNTTTFVSFGGLRACNSTYATGSNPAIDVCDVATGLVCSTINILSTGYFDAVGAAALTQCATACNVSKIYDQVGTNHWTQANNALRPLLKFSGCISPVGYCLRFTAASNMTLQSSNVTQAQPFTFSFVAGRWTGTAAGAIMDFGTASAVTYFNGSGTVDSFAGSNYSASATEGVLNAVQSVFNNASSNMYVNGSRTTGTVGTGAASAVPSKIGDDGNGDHPSIDFMEGGWVNGAMSNADEATINLNQKSSTSGWNF